MAFPVKVSSFHLFMFFRRDKPPPFLGITAGMRLSLPGSLALWAALDQDLLGRRLGSGKVVNIWDPQKHCGFLWTTWVFRGWHLNSISEYISEIMEISTQQPGALNDFNFWQLRLLGKSWGLHWLLHPEALLRFLAPGPLRSRWGLSELWGDELVTNCQGIRSRDDQVHFLSQARDFWWIETPAMADDWGLKR